MIAPSSLKGIFFHTTRGTYKNYVCRNNHPGRCRRRRIGGLRVVVRRETGEKEEKKEDSKFKMMFAKR